MSLRTPIRRPRCPDTNQITCSGLSTTSCTFLRLVARPKKALGDHSPAGYQQRARFYAISDEGRLNYAKRVAEYLVFLAETCAIADSSRIAHAKQALADTETTKTSSKPAASQLKAPMLHAARFQLLNETVLLPAKSATTVGGTELAAVD